MENKVEIVSPIEPDPATRGQKCIPVIVKNPVPTVNNPLEMNRDYTIIVDGLGTISGRCVNRRNHFAQIQESGGQRYWINTLMIQKIIGGDPI